ncbi:MAG: hydrolase [Spirochaetales bacterium]|nr:hydrolase [Spirochaetales bacterium]
MHKSNLTREQAFELLKKYNKDQFHIRHSLTMEGVMRWYACNLGFEDEADYWSQVGLLHDIDFENWPEEHCRKAPQLLKEGGCADDMIRSICSHGYGICVDIEPVELMEKVLFASDELSGLIWSASLMRPSKSVQDMEVKSVRKKYKDLKFAAGCSRDVINTGAERLGWELDKLIQMTLDAMRSCERSVEDYMAANY